MDRRTFLTTTLIGSVVVGIGGAASAAERYFPGKVNESLFDSINRIKVPGKKSPLEMSHAPVILAPASVNAGELFMVEVSVGEKVHDMGQTHWIEYIELAVGNEPAGRVIFQSRGFMKPRVSFAVTLQKDVATNGIVTLVARERCNLHGLWESTLNIAVL